MSDRPPRRFPGSSTAIAAAVVVLAAFVLTVLALSPGPAPDRLQDLSTRLRCPVCTSVSVAESPSDTAVEMRQVIADQIAAGRSDEEIVAYFRVRYGEWAVIDPPASGATMLLWILPGAATALGLLAVLSRIRRSPSRPPELSDQDRARVAAALAERRATPPGPEDEP